MAFLVWKEKSAKWGQGWEGWDFINRSGKKRTLTMKFDYRNSENGKGLKRLLSHDDSEAIITAATNHIRIHGDGGYAMGKAITSQQKDTVHADMSLAEKGIEGEMALMVKTLHRVLDRDVALRTTEEIDEIARLEFLKGVQLAGN
jgi:hypothetical protein